MKTKHALFMTMVTVANFSFGQGTLSVGSAELDLRTNGAGDSLLVFVRLSDISDNNVPVPFFNGLVAELKFTIRWPEPSGAIIGEYTPYCPSGFLLQTYQNTEMIPGNGYKYITFNSFGFSFISDACPEHAWPADEWKLVLRVKVLGDPSCQYPFQIVNDEFTNSTGRETYLELNGADIDHTIDNIPASLGNDLCGSIGGTLYADLNGDCMANAGDVPIPHRVLTTSVGSYGITNSMGQYFITPVPFGPITVQQAVSQIDVPLCPPGGSATANLDPDTPYQDVVFFNTPTQNLDLQVRISWVSATRPGFPMWMQMVVKNLSYNTSGPIQLSWTLDPILTDPTHPAGTMTLDPLGAFQQTQVLVGAQVPPDIGLIGEVLQFTVSGSNPLTETTTANNSHLAYSTITAAYDPNDKAGLSNSTLGVDRFDLLLDEYIDYTIRFQNTGNDTAFTVVIRDTLDIGLDITSLEILDASHAFEPLFETGRTLAFAFQNILLPDSATDLLYSQGFVSYRIKPVGGLLPGHAVSNTAAIYFDFNPPVITNTTVHVMELGTGTSFGHSAAWLLYPNPAQDLLTLLLPGGAMPRSVQVVGVDGRVIALPVQAIAGGIQLDVSGLASGAYGIRGLDGVAPSAVFLKH
jgi:uncharacterized repeat protein (TIGR01451 family)